MTATPTFSDIEENFRLAILEVTRQVEETCAVLDDPSERSMEKIRVRDDYIDNLKSLIENRSFARLVDEDMGDKQVVDQLRSFLIITSNLEKIADYTVNIVNQIGYLGDVSFIRRYDYRSFFEVAKTAFGSIVKALADQDVNLALGVCQEELTIDNYYKKNLDLIMGELKEGKETQNLVTCLFIFQYLERMGDALQNIGEAILLAIMGEKIKIREYRALAGSLAETDIDEPASQNVHYNGIWGTRSGSRIGSVSHSSKGNGETSVIFKHGYLKKLTEEKESILKWERIVPGLAPKIITFHEDNDSAALLLEYLPGDTLQDLILNADDPLLERALASFFGRTKSVWNQTLVEKGSTADFVAQMKSRLPDVRRLHPYFRSTESMIGAATAPGIDELIKSAEAVELSAAVPFTIRIHGDFNVNNLVYSQVEDTLRYLDLHRSCDGDYAQDASVFMVSIFRLPVFEPTARDRLNYVIIRFFRFLIEFAQEHGDKMIEPRLAVGLARSFITSSRFEYRRSFAEKMYLRGVYILEKLDASKDQGWDSFILSEEVFTY